MTGTYQYAGGTATLICTPYGTTTAVTAPSTIITTRSCADDGFPATWTRTASGSCIAPLVISAPVATGITVGGSCSEGGIAGYYGYAGGSANIACIPYVTATTAAPTATTPSAGTTATTTPPASITVGGACSEGGIAGYYGYAGGSANIACIPYVTATTAAPTAGTTFITTATIAPSLVGTWAYNTGDGTGATSCNYNGTMRCGWYYTATPGSYTMGPPR